jgi:hypothetical protein
MRRSGDFSQVGGTSPIAERDHCGVFEQEEDAGQRPLYDRLSQALLQFLGVKIIDKT